MALVLLLPVGETEAPLPDRTALVLMVSVVHDTILSTVQFALTSDSTMS